MWPAIEHGALLHVVEGAQCRALGHPWPPTPGALVVAHHPFRRRLIVKRVAARDGERFVLRGDAPVESEDSGTLGAFTVDALVGLVVKVEPPSANPTAEHEQR